jgi:hypothetical protein
MGEVNQKIQNHEDRLRDLEEAVFPAKKTEEFIPPVPSSEGSNSVAEPEPQVKGESEPKEEPKEEQEV